MSISGNMYATWFGWLQQAHQVFDEISKWINFFFALFALYFHLKNLNLYHQNPKVRILDPPLDVITMTDKQIFISGYELNGIMFTVRTVLQGYSIGLVSFLEHRMQLEPIQYLISKLGWS